MTAGVTEGVCVAEGVGVTEDPEADTGEPPPPPPQAANIMTAAVVTVNTRKAGGFTTEPITPEKGATLAVNGTRKACGFMGDFMTYSPTAKGKRPPQHNSQSAHRWYRNMVTVFCLCSKTHTASYCQKTCHFRDITKRPLAPATWTGIATLKIIHYTACPRRQYAEYGKTILDFYPFSLDARLRSCSFRCRLRKRMELGVISASSSSSINSTAYSSVS